MTQLLSDGRLTVLYVDDGTIEATCRSGRSDRWQLGYRRGAWWCSCPAEGRCAHVAALQLVTVREARRRPLPGGGPEGSEEPQGGAQVDPQGRSRVEAAPSSLVSGASPVSGTGEAAPVVQTDAPTTTGGNRARTR